MASIVTVNPLHTLRIRVGGGAEFSKKELGLLSPRTRETGRIYRSALNDLMALDLRRGVAGSTPVVGTTNPLHRHPHWRLNSIFG